jgi:hypothetical protein
MSASGAGSRGPLPQASRVNGKHEGLERVVQPRTDPPPKVPSWAGLGKAGQEFWEWAWSQPIAGMWVESDMASVARRAQIVDDLEAGEGTGSLHGQATALDKSLGLSPEARMRMRVRIADSSDSGEQPSKPGRVIKLVQ